MDGKMDSTLEVPTVPMLMIFAVRWFYGLADVSKCSKTCLDSSIEMEAMHNEN